MLVALTPRHQPAKAVQAALSTGTLADFGSADVIIAADAEPVQVENHSLWCTGQWWSATGPFLSTKQLLEAIPSPMRRPSEPLDQMDGAFGALLYDKVQKFVRLFSDRLGLIPLYLTRKPNLVLVGDCLGNVVSYLDEPLKAHDAAWAHWLVFGSFLGSDTPFSGVLCLGPGQWWTIELPTLTAQVERFDPLSANPDETLDRRETIAHITTLVQWAVERIVNANSRLRLVVPLSGGWDSRLIAGALRRAEIPFESVTTSRDSGSDLDRMWARQVAAHLEVPNTYYELPADYYLQVRDRYLQATDYGSVLHIWQQSFVDRLPAQSPALALDGYAGDLLLRGFGQPPPETNQTTEHAPDFYDHYRLKHGIEEVLAAPAKRLVESLSRLALQRELGPEPTPLDHLRFLLHNRNRRNVGLGPLRIVSQKMVVAFPFLDREVFDFVWRIPARFRFDPTFYPELLNSVFPGLGQLPSSNASRENATGPSVSIHKHAPEVIAFFRGTLERHPEDLGQLLDAEAIARAFQRIHRNPKRHIPTEFGRLEMAAHVAQWLRDHAAKLRPVRFLQEHFARQIGDFGPTGAISPQIHVPSVLTQEMRRWQLFQKIHGAAKPKLPLLLTMDVEAFAPGDIYAAHTSSGDPYERLVLGRFPNQSSVLEKIYRAEGNLCARWTLFVEMSCLWRFGEQPLAELIHLLRGSPHEIALHLHPFSLPKAFFEARQLEWNSYQTGRGLACILKEVVEAFTGLWGFAPRSYRAGRFDVYDGHFEALATCGLQTDSSLYQNSTFNHSKVGHNIGNRVERFAEGILEIPVTTYFDRRDPKLGLHPAMLDFDFTPLPVVFELLSRAQVQGLPTVVLLAHSWSFAESYRPKGIGKVVHIAPSQAAEEKLNWIIDFCFESQLLSFATCASFYKEISTPDTPGSGFDGLIEINANPDGGATGSIEMLAGEGYGWQSMHPALTVSHPIPTNVLASWQSFQPGAALYLELFGGDFFEPPPLALRALATLRDAKEILLTFREEADAEVDLLVFFMQYDEKRRVRSESQTVTATAEPRFHTLAFAREPAAVTFKVAVKLLPRGCNPGWVRLGGLRVLRRS